MIYAVVYAENSDVVATYESREEALHKLAAFVAADPTMQDDIGIRTYRNGRPVDRWTSASQLLGEHIPQGHLTV